MGTDNWGSWGAGDGSEDEGQVLVLTVHDDAPTLLMIKREIETGHDGSIKTIGARTIENALERIKSAKPHFDVILVHWELPEYGAARFLWAGEITQR